MRAFDIDSFGEDNPRVFSITTKKYPEKAIYDVTTALDDDAYIPTYATEGSAGADLYSIEHNVIAPHGWTKFNTGVHMAIPNNYVGLVFPRSGNAAYKGLTFENCVGVIDSDYRGAIRVILKNDSDIVICVHKGDRVGQIILMPRIFLPHRY